MAFFHSKIKSRNHTSTWLSQVANQEVIISISDTNIQNQFKAIDLRVEDLKIAKTILPLIKEHLIEIAAAFFKALNNVPETTKIITTYSNPDRWIKDTWPIFSTNVSRSF